MQHIETDQGELIEVFENDLDKYLHLFCEENDIPDMKKESQSVWNSCLRYIYTHVFKGKDLLKSKVLHNNINNTIPSNYNSYDYNILNHVLDLYIYNMCMKYDKEVSIIGFSTLTGVSDVIIHEWGNNGKPSSLSFNIYKKLNQFREESLSNKLATANKNPVGVLAILNRHYQWNLPGVSKETTNKNNISLEDLRGKVLELSQNQTQFIDSAVVDNGE